MLSQKLLPKGPNEETMEKNQKDKKEVIRKNSGCCASFFSKPSNDHYQPMIDNKKDEPKHRAPASQSNKSKNYTTDTNDCCGPLPLSDWTPQHHNKDDSNQHSNHGFFDHSSDHHDTSAADYHDMGDYDGGDFGGPDFD